MPNAYATKKIFIMYNLYCQIFRLVMESPMKRQRYFRSMRPSRSSGLDGIWGIGDHFKQQLEQIHGVHTKREFLGYMENFMPYRKQEAREFLLRVFQNKNPEFPHTNTNAFNNVRKWLLSFSIDIGPYRATTTTRVTNVRAN